MGPDSRHTVQLYSQIRQTCKRRLVQLVEDVVIELVSEGLEARTDFLRTEDVGLQLRGLFGPQVDSQLDELVQAGLFEGKLDAVHASAVLTRDGRSSAVQVSMIPFRVQTADVDYVVRVEVRYPAVPEEDLEKVEPEMIMVPQRKPELEA